VGGVINPDWDRRLDQLIEFGGRGDVEIAKVMERTDWIRNEDEDGDLIDVTEPMRPIEVIFRSLLDMWSYMTSSRQPEGAAHFGRACLMENARLVALGLYTIDCEEPAALPPPIKDEPGFDFMSSQMSYSYDLPSSQPTSTARTTQSEARGNATARVIKGQEAIDRLAHLALSINRYSECATQPRSRMLDHWPDEPGVPTDDYISTLRRPEVEAQEEALRQKVKLEEKRRRVAERFGLLPKIEASELSSQAPIVRHGSSPTRQTRPRSTSVMPSSSQTMGFPMSQPLPGAYGTRNLFQRKKKKKTGIR
jgi:hypothetical protein